MGPDQLTSAEVTKNGGQRLLKDIDAVLEGVQADSNGNVDIPHELNKSISLIEDTAKIVGSVGKEVGAKICDIIF